MDRIERIKKLILDIEALSAELCPSTADNDCGGSCDLFEEATAALTQVLFGQELA